MCSVYHFPEHDGLPGTYLVLSRDAVGGIRQQPLSAGFFKKIILKGCMLQVQVCQTEAVAFLLNVEEACIGGILQMMASPHNVFYF